MANTSRFRAKINSSHRPRASRTRQVKINSRPGKPINRWVTVINEKLIQGQGNP
jgi:hypothetical protein